MRRPYFHICIIIVFLSMVLFSGCVTPSENCPPSTYADLSNADIYSDDSKYPFRFPVDNLTEDQLLGAIFATYGYTSSSPNSKEYHAAEDYHQPAGSPVYAMADGTISYSGPRKGYGWLVIVDHPEINLYSLYGHLSPSRWRIRSGTVQKGQLIAYLGDPDENGGSKENPLRPHLHFGIRLGQRADYPTMGEWRWQAGWIKYCPQDLGWLQPSVVINNQAIPDAGLKNPESSFVTMWWTELLWSLFVLIGAITGLIINVKKNNTIMLLIFSIVLSFFTWYTFYRLYIVRYALLVLCCALVVIWLLKLLRKRQNRA